jgi:amino acid adenylation domain-containing protein
VSRTSAIPALHIDPSALSRLNAHDRTRFELFGIGRAAAPPLHRIHHAFEAHARRRPGAPAVEHLGERLTYGELDQRANTMAAHLARLGVQPGDRVGVFLRRSTGMVVAIMAALKAGAAYVPQDVRIAPPAHLEHIVRTAGIRVVLTLAEYADQLAEAVDALIVPVDRPVQTGPRGLQSAVAAPAAFVRPSLGAADHPAMVIFTSGTTGRPNGVVVTHENLCNFLLLEPGGLGVRPGMRVAQLLNIAFDMAAWEVLGALSHGATLVIRGCEIEETARRVDVVIATPGVLATLDADRCRNVRIVAVAGERCPQPLADTWASFARFHNGCGPTEVTIVNTLSPYEPAPGELTIGAPVPNTTVYVLDDNLQPCSIGEVGEMWAGGACVTAGYLGNPALTNERYLPDPFLGKGFRMFRTRDLGRWTERGELEHHGRTDDMVKVHGFRVELDAVTTALELAPHCWQATTVQHDGELYGFVTPTSVDVAAARRSVEATLPYYYLPRMIFALDELPKTSRGKVDKAALRAALSAEPTPQAIRAGDEQAFVRSDQHDGRVAAIA